MTSQPTPHRSARKRAPVVGVWVAAAGLLASVGLQLAGERPMPPAVITADCAGIDANPASMAL